MKSTKELRNLVVQDIHSQCRFIIITIGLNIYIYFMYVHVHLFKFIQWIRTDMPFVIT